MRHKHTTLSIPCPYCGEKVVRKNLEYGAYAFVEPGKPIAIKEDPGGDTKIISSFEDKKVKGFRLDGINHTGPGEYIGSLVHECKEMEKARRYIG